ncbi:hypothetical protein B0H21DRAFT_693218, partial [Amylocystis lapponica]
IAAAAILSTRHYFLLGWNITIDVVYEHSFEIWLACTVVSPGAGNLGFTLLEYCLGRRSLFDSGLENITWIPFFFFFGGLSIHLSDAVLAHLFSYNITWGAMRKEVERSNFWLEVPKILNFVRPSHCTVAMIVLTTDLILVGWKIESWDWAVIFPSA